LSFFYLFFISAHWQRFAAFAPCLRERLNSAVRGNAIAKIKKRLSRIRWSDLLYVRAIIILYEQVFAS
jgi:hypothetical protein